MKNFILSFLALFIVLFQTHAVVVFDIANNPWNLPLGSGQGESATAGNVTRIEQDNVVIYNLSGQRLSQPQRGINIVNGKKVVVKGR